MKQNSGKQTLAYADLSGSECTKRKQSGLLAVHDQSRAQPSDDTARRGCAQHMRVQWVHDST